eukprot:TRINITY_DN2433_c0_g1_i1.p1 TRINITY_DN2433_c0_g1~~TRINITY_DN2433_c0_g1_i1.p1  ORF type:complete len:1610 (+),score=459.01 TRINITY_DN2433_c0_g1_i1:619-4830(+)
MFGTSGRDADDAKIISLVGFIEEVTTYGEAFINIIATELAAPTSEGQDSALDRLMCLHHKFPQLLRHKFYEFYYKFLPDYKFKKNFVKSILKNYDLLIRENLTTENESTDVLGLCVQVFTVSSICLDFVQNERLLHVLLKSLYSILSDSMNPDNIMNCSNRIIDKSMYFKAYINVRHVLANVNVSQYACYHWTEILSEVLHSLALCHGTNPNIRETRQHIVMELPWINSINLEIWMNRYIDSLVKGYKCGPEMGGDNFTPTTAKSAPEDFELPISYIRIVLERWWDCHPDFYPEESNTYRGYPVSKFQVSKGPISMHLILHRTLSAFLQITTSLWDQKLEDVLQLHLYPAPKSFVSRLLMEPLRLQAFFAQVGTNMWIRNGRSLMSAKAAYFELLAYSPLSFHRDIYLMQSCLVMLGFDHFLSLAIDAFDLSEFFSSSQNGREKEMEISEEFLLMLITVLTERICVGATNRQILRRYLVHNLCVGENTHSNLLELVPKQYLKNENFDSVLSEVATYHSPSGKGNVGTFNLKPEIWSEYEGRNFRGHSPEQLEQSLANFKENFQKKKQTARLPTIFCLDQDVRLNSAFSSLESCVDCGFLHEILFRSLTKIRNGGLDVMLTHVLTLLKYCGIHSGKVQVENRPRNTSTEQQRMFASDNFLQNAFEKHPAVPLVRLESIVTLLISIHKDGNYPDFNSPISEILGVFKDRGISNSELDDYLQENGEKKPEEALPEVARVSRDERLKKSADRQQEILAKFAKQQNEFSKKFAGELQKTEVSEMETCCLCRDTSSDHVTNPIGVISYVDATSRVNQTVYRINTGETLATEPSQKNVPLRKLAPMPVSNRDHIESSIGIEMSSCGHVIHAECFERYQASIQQRARSMEMYEGRGVVNVEQGEFLCPLCRTISNTVVPTVPTEIRSGKDIDISMETKIDLSLKHFFSRFGKHMLPSEGFASFVEYTEIVHRQISMGRASYSFDWISYISNSKKLKSLENLCNATCLWEIRRKLIPGSSEPTSNLPSSTSSISRLNLLQQLLLHQTEETVDLSALENLSSDDASLDDTPETVDTVDEKCPELMQDLFGVLVRKIFGENLDENEILNLIRQIYPTIVVQSAVSILRKRSLYESHYSPGNFVESDGKSEDDPVFSMIRKTLEIPSDRSSDEFTKKMVLDLTLPFLRRCLILLNGIFPEKYFEKIEDISLIQEEDLDQLDEISEIFRILEISDPWKIDLEEFCGELEENSLKIREKWIDVAPPNFFSLIQLPQNFQDFLTRYDTVTCQKCQKCPKSWALCLVCGDVACIGQCCATSSGRSEAIAHMRQCAGRGAFFLLKECTTFVAVKFEGNFTHGFMDCSTYRDRYGEEDKGFQRGKPLYLSSADYEEMRWWVMDGHKMLSESAKRGSKRWKF